MKYDDEIEAGASTDEYVHLCVIGRDDKAPPYSTDQKTAECLAQQFKFAVKPVYSLGPKSKYDPVKKEFYGDPECWTVMIQVEQKGDKGMRAHGLRVLSHADTYPLCVCRSVLLLKNLVRPAWKSYDADGNEIPDDWEAL